MNNHLHWSETSIKIGIIGCGNIGSELALFADEQSDCQIARLCDPDAEKIVQLVSKLKNNQPKTGSIHDLLLHCDLLVEAANKNVVKEILENLVLYPDARQVLILSSGGLFENLELMNSLSGHHFIVPSGAIAGLDALKSVAGKIEELHLTTTKPLGSLPAGGLKMNESKVTIFDGELKEAISLFPQNINVAATIFLATRFKGLRIKIIADKDASDNRHEIFCKGPFGEIRTTTINKPSQNPKTSFLAILSAIASLKQILSDQHLKKVYVG
jgi:aspartate dehydrogenase